MNILKHAVISSKGSANHLVLDTGGVRIVIEKCCVEYSIRKPLDSCIFCTNHYINSVLQCISTPHKGAIAANSIERFNNLLSITESLPDHSIKTMMYNILRDHTQPGTICQHGQSVYRTVISMIMLPRKLAMLVA